MPKVRYDLRGLGRQGFETLAHDIAPNRVGARVFESTGTRWENYAPEHNRTAVSARPDFIGWSGLPLIAV